MLYICTRTRRRQGLEILGPLQKKTRTRQRPGPEEVSEGFVHQDQKKTRSKVPETTAA